MTVPDDCKDCLRASIWEGTPTGEETTLGKNQAYKAGDNPDYAVLFIHDAAGWTFPNARLLVDYFAKEVGATVFMPDFFGGEVLPIANLLAGPGSQAWEELDLPAFSQRNSKEIRGPEISACAAALRSDLGFKKIGTVGYCFGGWAVFRLGAQVFLPDGTVREAKDAASQDGAVSLVDAISTAHPSWLTKEEIAETRVPTQIIAPEHDMQLSPELKSFANETIPKLGVEYEYRYFPGQVHAFATKADEKVPGEKQAANRAARAVVGWFLQILKE